MDALPDVQQLRSVKGLPTVVVIAAGGKVMPLTGKHMLSVPPPE